MPPFRVVVLDVTGTRLDLIVPCDSSLTFTSLIQETSRRAVKRSCNVIIENGFELRLGSETGFLIDVDDKIEDVLDPSEVLYLITSTQALAATTTTTPQQGKNGIKIRIITPLGALRHIEVRHLPILKNGQIFVPSTTLAQLRADILEHLGLAASESKLVSVQLDLHTIESPIQTSRHELTIEDMKLVDLAVNGILSVYVVEWRSEGNNKSASGKDGLFAAAPCWLLPVKQSDRAISAALSCLRVFSHVANDKSFDENHHNEILRIFHLLTHFPPAVRAMNILISGKTLLPSERAALIQSMAATLGDLIPRPLIEHDSGRFLEASRLLLGLILYKVKQIKISESTSMSSEVKITGSRPWIDGLRTIDVKDCLTFEPVIDPIQTSLGLMEKSNYISRVEDGSNSSSLITFERTDDVNLRELRVILLFGGVSDEVSYYDADILTKAYLQAAQSDTLKSELATLRSDLKYLGALCDETKLCVVAPRQLSSAEAPCLTLDRDGNLAVYTGQAPCAPPDKDKAIYYPLTGREDNVDVNIVAQMLEPILKARQADGTAVFDLCTSGFKRKDTTPTELLVVAIDVSHSMTESSDFADVVDEDAIRGFTESSSFADDVVIDDENEAPVEYSEIRNFLTEHESYQDMLAIVSAAQSRTLKSTAEEIIEFLRTLTTREIHHLAQAERNTRDWATETYFQSRGQRSRERVDSLRRILSGLNHFSKALCDHLIFHAKDQAWSPPSFTWSFGMPIPKIEREVEDSAPVDLQETFVVPTDYICPIKQSGVIEDPVMTSDSLGPYERRSIETWFRRSNTSPLTGLQLANKSLRRNQPVAESIKKWVNGDDITSAISSSASRPRRSGRDRVKLNFITPNGLFSRTLPISLSLADLYNIVFRGMRGVYYHFSLHIDGTTLACSNMTLVERGLRSGQQITVQCSPQAQPIGSDQTEWQEEMCLLKIYTSIRAEATEVLSYWLPRSTSVTLASVLFRSWRFHQNSWRRHDYDCNVWTGLQYNGDNSLVGQKHHTWEAVSAKFDLIRPTEIHDEDELCATKKPSKPDVLEDVLTDAGYNMHGPSYGSHRVLKVALCDYRSPEEEEARRLKKLRTLTRMGVTKSIFSAFINRLIAYDYSTNIGLVVFGTKAKVTQKLTDVVENFRTAIEKMQPEGDTALWDSLALAADHLAEYGRNFPEAKKRILCLSDGTDTSSNKIAVDVARSLVQNSIVLDSCSIGNEDNGDLRAVSYLTGGYKFVPKSLEDAVSICELEPVLNLDERPPIKRPVGSSFLTPAGFSLAVRYAEPDKATRDAYPQHKTHPNLEDSFVQIGNFAQSTATEPATNVGSGVSLIRTQRLLKEIRDIALRPHPSYDVYVSESDMSFWKVVLQGPSGSAYETGTFVIYLHMEDSYPRRAPKGRFVTKIFHPNINKGGRICHSIFDRNWTVDTSNKQVLDTVFGLMLVPEFSDPVNTTVTLQYYWDEVAFKSEVEEHIAKYASKGREELKQEILGV